jgi:formiminoglutamase
MSNFKAASPDLFFSKKDPQDPRRGERTKSVSSLTDLAPGFVLTGYPDDEGIKNNGGRVGAAAGPDAIRKFFYKMVASDAPTYDLGNLTLASDLPKRHEIARKAASEALEHKQKWIGLGGGHDYGFADGAGFLDWSKSQSHKPIIINFDAHLDVRKPGAVLNSGTPFFRLLEMGVPFDFVQIGIQRQCNSSAHLEYCESKGARVLRLDEFWASKKPLDEYLQQRVGDLLSNKRPCFLSVDIDAFAWPYAIGSSQSWPTGIEPRDFWPCAEYLMQQLDVKALGIYETSPPLDFDYGTSKLAALIVDTFVRKSAL